MSERKLTKHRATIGRGDLERRDWFYLCSDVDELLQRDHTELFKRVSDDACGELVDVKRERDALLSLNAELLEALEEVAGDLFLQIEPKHGAKAASQYPSFVKARAAIAKARSQS